MKLNFSGKETIDVAPQTLWDAVIDPKGPNSGESRVLRDGSFIGSPADLRSARRNGGYPGGWGDSNGFRCVRVPSH